MTPPATIGRAVATIALVSACGARGDLLNLGDGADAGPDAVSEHAGGGASAGGASGRGGTAGSSNDAAPGGTAGTSPTDASVITDATRPIESGIDAMSFDADGTTADVITVADCTCPIADYFIDVVIGSDTARLTHPYPLDLYCHETAPQMEHPPCSEIYSLTGCAGDAYGKPCLYLSTDLARGPLIGNYVDPSGQTWEMADLSMQVGPIASRIVTGSFSANFRSRVDGGILTASGSFRACVARLPVCTR